jgi:hypothetical protein
VSFGGGTGRRGCPAKPALGLDTRAAALVSLCLLTACRIGYDPVESGLSDGSVTPPDGSVIPPDGSVIPPDGSVSPSDGVCDGQTGVVDLAEVTVEHPGGAALTDYAIRVSLDTAHWIEQGWLAADCSNLELATDAGPLAIWVPEHACGEPDAAIWVKLPQLVADAPVSIVVRACPQPRPSDPAGVFSYFEGFDEAQDWSVEQPGWSLHGNRLLEQTGDGVLRLPAGGSSHKAAIESALARVRSDVDVLGVRFRTNATQSDDFEIGAGTLIDPGDELWHGARVGTWVTAVHWDSLSATMSSGATRCLNERADRYHLAAAWYEAEFHYHAGEPNRFEFTAEGEGGRGYSFTSSSCGILPEQLPILIVFDHSDAGTNRSSEIDWIYLRPRATEEPVVTVH